MLKLNFKIFCLLIGIFSFFIFIALPQKQTYPVAAYLRVKDEIKTIEACLNSIDGVFDRIVIIHSNEKDDGSVAFMNAWCQQRSACEIHEYPHAVIPSHDKRYDKAVPYENTLAAYNEFGLQFFAPNEWVVKIDADQVYLTERLKEFVSMVKQPENDGARFALIGYNTFPYQDYFVKYGPVPINGLGGDSYVLQRKNFLKFYQIGYFEDVTFENNLKKKNIWDKPVWFHFMKTLKSKGLIRNNSEAKSNEVAFLSENEKELFNTHIRPLLKNSPYYHLKLEK